MVAEPVIMAVDDNADFLEQAIKLHPNGKRILLTAYADTEAAFSL